MPLAGLNGVLAGVGVSTPSPVLPPVASSLGALGVSNLDAYRSTNSLGLAGYLQPNHNDVTINGRGYVLAPLDNTGSGVDDGFALVDPSQPNNGAQLYNADGSYRKFLPTIQAAPFATWLATSIVSIVGFAFGAAELGAGTTAAGTAGSTALDEAANVGAANAINDASYAGADWGNVADFSAGGSAPLPAVADLAPAAAPSVGAGASSGLSMPSLQQVGQALGIGSTVAGLAGGKGGGSLSTVPRGTPGLVPFGTGVHDNGTTAPGTGGPTYYAGTPGAGGAQYLQPSQDVGGVAPSVLFLGAAAVVVLAIALGHQ